MTLRVMTFNVLYDAVRNLVPAWARRRPLVAETIRSAGPDVVCLQEVSHRQLDDLVHDLPEYEFLPGAVSGSTRVPPWAPGVTGIARLILGDFLDRGELCPILLRKGRVSSVQHGSFWVSPDGESSESVLGGSPTPHVVNWARLEAGPGATCTIYNTHRGVLPWNEARTAIELLSTLDRHWKDEPQLLVGDLNCPPAGPLVRRLTADRSSDHPAFRDAWLDAKVREGSGRTFHWGFGLPGPRVDYILVRPQCLVSSATASEARIGGIFASDHFALAAELVLTPVR
jgi:endonuclease/exonuclease/phosphatase family metal-dependent hydrolase